MKSIGVVRHIDRLGRIVLPMELRKVFGIKQDDPIEIYVDEDKIVLKLYKPACVFCGNANDMVSYKGYNVCKKCLEELKSTEE